MWNRPPWDAKLELLNRSEKSDKVSIRDGVGDFIIHGGLRKLVPCTNIGLSRVTSIWTFFGEGDILGEFERNWGIWTRWKWTCIWGKLTRIIHSKSAQNWYNPVSLVRYMSYSYSPNFELYCWLRIQELLTNSIRNLHWTASNL